MAKRYTFWDMLHDILFNRNRTSAEHFNDYPGNHKSNDDAFGGLGNDSSSHRVVSREFNPSDEAGEAFRSVFGDDN